MTTRDTHSIRDVAVDAEFERATRYGHPRDRVGKAEPTSRYEALLSEDGIHHLVTPTRRSNITRANQHRHEEPDLLIRAIGREFQPRPRRHRRDWPRWSRLGVEGRNFYDGPQLDHHDIQADGGEQ